LITTKDFDPSTLAFSGYLTVNVIVIIVGITWNWTNFMFDPHLFWLGLAGSIINTLGIVCAQNAIAKGPAGPASALSAAGNILLTIIEALKYKRVPNHFEILGLLIGTLGALILVVPNWFYYYCNKIKRCCCFCCKKKRNGSLVKESFIDSLDYF
jgi:drug/metabolite transporter (DMT)-like permease